MRKVELLLPAGNLEKLKYAVKYGADAVYLGVVDFSLRAMRKGEIITLENLKSAVDLAHLLGAKAYLTLNIFAFNSDIKHLEECMDIIKDANPDAVLVSDFGILRLLKKYMPEVELHISTQTNILNAVFSENYEDSTVVKLSGRYSSKINVMAESDDAEKSSQTIDKFYEMTDKNIFTVKEMNINKMLDTYKKYQYNLLSSKNIKRLENNFYESVTAESLENLYNPLGITLLPLDEDPFMLFTDYIKSLSTGSGDYSLINYNDKYYSVLTLEINPDTALSPTKINGEIKNLIKQQKKLSVDGVKVYLTGTPIHSYYASSRSMLEINIICILSAVFLFALFRYYFSNIKLIIPTAISISLGILLGYIVCSLIFQSIHVLTFVFSTTLIGICIDYSLHYYIEKDLSKIFKSLTISMLTTVIAFLILLFLPLILFFLLYIHYLLQVLLFLHNLMLFRQYLPYCLLVFLMSLFG